MLQRLYERTFPSKLESEVFDGCEKTVEQIFQDFRIDKFEDVNENSGNSIPSNIQDINEGVIKVRILLTHDKRHMIFTLTRRS